MDTKAVNAEIVMAVTGALTALGVQVVLDATSSSLGVCKVPPGDVAILLTSPAAIQAYDNHHPERIACLVLRKLRCTHTHPTFRVFVNDRDMDPVSTARFWWTSDPPTLTMDTECTICCMKQPRARARARAASFAICPQCHCVLCLTCYDKTRDSGAHKCPVCRQWSLDGGLFGVPWPAGASMHPKPQTPVDMFCQVLDRLDGNMTLLPRVGNQMWLEDELCISKLARTQRTTPQSLSLEQVRDRLKRLCAAAFDRPECHEVRLYMFRETFRIHMEKPVEEVSQFSMTRTALRQLSPEAWGASAFGKSPHVHRVKVAYLPAHVFALPDAVAQLLLDVNTQFAGLTKTLCFVHEHLGAPSVTLDVDGTGAPLTMHMDMLTLRLETLLTTAAAGQNLYLLCRAQQIQIVAVYEFDATAFRRLGPTDTERILQLGARVVS